MFILSAGLLFQILMEQTLPLYEGSLRFHVRAASDTVLEQELKISARDAALKMIRKTADRAGSARELENDLKKQEAEIKEGVRACLRSAGHERNVKVYFAQERFPILRYGAIIFPAGRYHALRIDIGGGRGHNWWCALYPELCYNEKEFVLSEKGSKDLKTIYSGSERISAGEAKGSFMKAGDTLADAAGSLLLCRKEWVSSCDPEKKEKGRKYGK